MTTNRWIAVGIFAAFILFFFAWSVGANNTAIGMDESIKNSQSGIQVQQQRRFDLITKLVQVVEQNSKYEGSTQTEIAQMRSAVAGGDMNGASMAIKAVAEAYPDLKANASYTQLMTELSLTENRISEYRDSYNNSVKDYNRFVRRWPNSMFLNLGGYQIVQYPYLEFANNQLPDQLFQK